MKFEILETYTLEEMENSLAPFFAQNFHQFHPFQAELIQFCEALSEEIFQQPDIKTYPDFVALAFWLRKSHVMQLQQAFLQNTSPKTVLMPRGLVFHIPPASIDVMLVYSWISSLLVGNANIIRIPSNKPDRFDKLLEIIIELLSQEKFKHIKEMTCFINYGYEEALTAFISLHAAARIIWGGDETVSNIRRILLNPRAKDIVFPDRYSFAVIRASKYLEAPQEEKQQCITNFFNDVYWFDQSACSSPRLIYWVGDEDTIKIASKQFYEALHKKVDERHYEISLGGALLKKTYAYNQTIILPVEKVMQYSNELTVITLETANNHCRVHCGQGLIYHVSIHNIKEIVPFVTSHDQTLTYYGFDSNELRQLALELNGKGLTRMVPFGQALNFEPVWDGVDLFAELTQHVVVEGVQSQ